MNKFDLIKIVNEKPYMKYNLCKDMHGVVLNTFNESVNVLFFNPNNIGDFAIVKDIALRDIEIEQEELTKEMKKELEANVDKIIKNANSKIEPIKINEYDMVELLVESDKYTKFGIHKGETGIIATDYAVDDYVLVDFSGIDKNGEYYGDCISVNMKDLKILR